MIIQEVLNYRWENAQCRIELNFINLVKPYSALKVTKEEMDKDVDGLYDQACNVDGQHQDQPSHSIRSIKRPH
jgi:hypothetical protein